MQKRVVVIQKKSVPVLEEEEGDDKAN